MSLTPSNETVILFGEDRLIFCKMRKKSITYFHRSLEGWKVFFLKPILQLMLWVQLLQKTSSFNILWAFFDATSAMFMQGKIKFQKFFVKNLHLADAVKIFNVLNTNRVTSAAGKRFLVSLYDYSRRNVSMLNHLRYISYTKNEPVDTIWTSLLYHHMQLQHNRIL